ncbi:MAG: hypothetical protein AAGE52_08890 [Myxococcota bacterium]
MRPIEWLLEVTQFEDGFSRLLEESGGLPVAAWKLANARCRTRETSTSVPTRAEVRAAARHLASKLGLGPVPPSAVLAADCERQGLLVI